MSAGHPKRRNRELFDHTLAGWIDPLASEHASHHLTLEPDVCDHDQGAVVGLHRVPSVKPD